MVRVKIKWICLKWRGWEMYKWDERGVLGGSRGE